MIHLHGKDWLRRACLVLTIAASAGARAGTLYTIDTVTHELQSFDTHTLAFTNIGSVGAGFDFGDLAYDGSTMYMSQGFAGTNLYTINLTNASTTLVGNTGLGNLFGLTFDGSGNLWGGLSTGNRGVYSINKTNANATFIGDPGVFLDGMTYLPNSKQVVGVYAGQTGLYSINTATGGSTLLSTEPYINNCGIAWDPDTQKIWVMDWSGQVMTIDPTTYAATIVLKGLDAHDGCASASPAPEPATIIGASIGVLALLRRRRTR